MKNYNFLKIFVKIMLLLLVLTIIIISMYSYLTLNSDLDLAKNDIKNKAIKASTNINFDIKNYLAGIENEIDAIRSNQLFINYLNSPTNKNKKNVESLFIYSMKTNPQLFQFRYIDITGKEKVRVNKVQRFNKFIPVKDSDLQNKSQRYYFKETLKTHHNEFWHSRLDLNIENNVIERPFKPVFRIAKKVMVDNSIKGILIVNIDMSELLNKIQKNEYFDIFVFDNDGYFLVNPDTSKNWSRYLKTNHKIYHEYPLIKYKKFYDDSLGFIFYFNGSVDNDEELQLFLKVKEKYLESVNNNNLSAIISSILLLFFPAALIATAISFFILSIFKRFSTIKNENIKYVGTIDKYVLSLSTDENYLVTFASEALCKRSGYNKEELLGKKASIFKSGDMPKEFYNELRSTISKGLVWSGEFQNRTKNGEIYWLSSVIVPNFDEEKNIVGFTALSEDITDKKIIEKLSQTDKLTQLHNRVKLDETLSNEYDRFSRYQIPFSIIIIDIDYFKSINDTYGHNIGDSVLVEISQILSTHCRKTDVVGRWGGEEFLIISTETPLEGAITLANKLREEIDNFEFKVIQHKTISVGVSQIRQGESVDALIKRADSHLYEAKNNGRNQVVTD